MQIDILIIGQGICGTMLSWFLNKAGKSFLVIDDNNANTPSKVAAGIINPVTGRRFVYSWMIDTVMPFAAETYNEIGIFFNQKIIEQKASSIFFHLLKCSMHLQQDLPRMILSCTPIQIKTISTSFLIMNLVAEK
jgi:2-polyprenyl-6-methoxyphenol hydroxylase-like FAD-dependent oxidoreductase